MLMISAFLDQTGGENVWPMLVAKLYWSVNMEVELRDFAPTAPTGLAKKMASSQEGLLLRYFGTPVARDSRGSFHVDQSTMWRYASSSAAWPTARGAVRLDPCCGLPTGLGARPALYNRDLCHGLPQGPWGNLQGFGAGLALCFTDTLVGHPLRDPRRAWREKLALQVAVDASFAQAGDRNRTGLLDARS